MSRVVSLARMGARPIHPTQLYSLLFCLALFAVQLRLALAYPSWSFLAGSYLILSALARFIEEAYRGEPQTKISAQLTVYQWLSVGMFIAGLLTLGLTCPASSAVPHLLGLRETILAAGLGLVTAFAMSVDFPDSGGRFSCLTIRK